MVDGRRVYGSIRVGDPGTLRGFWNRGDSNQWQRTTPCRGLQHPSSGVPSNPPPYVNSIAGSSIRRSPVRSQASLARSGSPGTGRSRAAMAPLRIAYPWGRESRRVRMPPRSGSWPTKAISLFAGIIVQHGVQLRNVEPGGKPRIQDDFAVVPERLRQDLRRLHRPDERAGENPGGKSPGIPETEGHLPERYASPGAQVSRRVRHRRNAVHRFRMANEIDPHGRPYLPSDSRNRSASMAARQPAPAAVTACR